jgi:hypothetical protein
MGAPNCKHCFRVVMHTEQSVGSITASTPIQAGGVTRHGKNRRVDHCIDPNCGGYGDPPYENMVCSHTEQSVGSITVSTAIRAGAVTRQGKKPQERSPYRPLNCRGCGAPPSFQSSIIHRQWRRPALRLWYPSIRSRHVGLDPASNCGGYGDPPFYVGPFVNPLFKCFSFFCFLFEIPAPLSMSFPRDGVR